MRDEALTQEVWTLKNQVGIKMLNFLEVKGIKVKRLVIIFYPTDWQKLKKIIIPMVG